MCVCLVCAFNVYTHAAFARVKTHVHMCVTVYIYMCGYVGVYVHV